MSRRGENIRKRKDGRWEGRYIKGYDSKKQKARYASVYGKTYAETKQKLDEAKYKSSIGVVYVDAKNKLFGEIINSWFNAKKINLKPSSIIKYQNLIEKHILPELGHRKLRELNADFLMLSKRMGTRKMEVCFPQVPSKPCFIFSTPRLNMPHQIIWLLIFQFALQDRVRKQHQFKHWSNMKKMHWIYFYLHIFLGEI